MPCLWFVIVTSYSERSSKNEGYSADVDVLIRAVAEGYPFPTNLDRRSPAPRGMAPESEEDKLRKALQEGWGWDGNVDEFVQMQHDATT